MCGRPGGDTPNILAVIRPPKYGVIAAMPIVGPTKWKSVSALTHFLSVGLKTPANISLANGPRVMSRLT